MILKIDTMKVAILKRERDHTVNMHTQGEPQNDCNKKMLRSR